MAFGEIPERERRFDGEGFSTGKPSTLGKTEPAPDRVTGVSRGFVVGLTSTKILTQNFRRAYLLFQNRGTDTIFVAFGDSVSGDAAHSNAVQIPAGGVYEPNTNAQYIMCNDIYALSNSASQLLVIVEGSFTYG